MPPRSKIALLPATLRCELERRMVENAFSRYAELSHWLQTLGHQIAEQSVQRYGAGLKHKLAALERAANQARAIANARRGRTINDAIENLVDRKIFAALVETERLDDPEVDQVKLIRALANLSHSMSVRRRLQLSSRIKRRAKSRTQMT